ncbi:MAG: plasmid pRiA4b ORF-3 family protein [Chlamydiota bacterium]
MNVYRLKIILKDIHPPIWRRIEVLGSNSLNDLHLMIQAVMGWENYHPHIFQIKNITFSDDSETPNDRNDNDHTLAQVIDNNETKKFLYIYDFGDDWIHEVKVESVHPASPKKSYPQCLSGRRACPPEDCGGPWGYAEYLKALKDPDHPEHEEKLEWRGEYDPEYFSLEETKNNLTSWKKYGEST